MRLLRFMPRNENDALQKKKTLTFTRNDTGTYTQATRMEHTVGTTTSPLEHIATMAQTKSIATTRSTTTLETHAKVMATIQIPTNARATSTYPEAQSQRTHTTNSPRRARQ